MRTNVHIHTSPSVDGATAEYLVSHTTSVIAFAGPFATFGKAVSQSYAKYRYT